MTKHPEGIEGTIEWFRVAWPDPGAKFQVQSGTHCEEVAEWLDSLGVADCNATYAGLLQKATTAMKDLAHALKHGHITLVIENRKDCLDGLVDQLVTGVGVAFAAGMDPVEALNRVNTSNFSKFVDGEAIFDANGKVAKGPNYAKPDLEGLY